MKRCLMIFAKEPRRGRVKTRLRSLLNDALCLQLYKAFLQDTIALAQKVDCEEKIIAYDSAGKQPRYLMTIAPRFNFYRQRGSDLGRKMHHAFQYAQKIKAQKTIIIGSDTPDLPVRYIREAFRKLDEADVVLGPCCDGGYYLIGLQFPCQSLFTDIRWSSADVMRATIQKARKAKKRVVLLKKWYDIDIPASLGHFASRRRFGRAAGHTRGVLQCMNLNAITRSS